MKNKKVKCTSIGGQAVLEGVMMRGEKSMATAVRDEDGIIRIEAKRIVPTKKKKLFFRLPIIRGVCAFIQSLVGGTSVLMRSAEVYGEGEPSKFEKWLSDKLHIKIMSVITTISLILGLALAIGLFILLPLFLRKVIEWLITGNTEYLSFAYKGSYFNIWAKNFIEGGFKLLIFILYILLCSLVKDVKRTFMYHGAEHKTISCFESGKELTVANAKTCSRVHNRCGTTFMVFVLFISILLFACFEALINGGLQDWARFLCKIALLPIVAGLSYELLKGLAKTNCWVFYPIKLPGLLLQRITTKEPDDSMLEVAITAFKKVQQMDENESIPECNFVVSEKCNVVFERVKDTLRQNGILEDAEAEWIISISANIKRDEVKSDKYLSPKQIDGINKIVDERITGRPLWYVIGDTDFYGYKIKVDERVLIPRPETELLVENAIKYINKDSCVLDLCTGSGAIAIAIFKETNAKVTASDISQGALTLAKENATLNCANIEFIESDLFDNILDKKFDVIVTNPPYIKSADIDTLQKEVKDFEPKLALDGGIDGLDLYRRIAKFAKNMLNDNGVILLECGFDTTLKVKELFSEYSSTEIIKDYEGIDRIVKVVK